MAAERCDENVPYIDVESPGRAIVVKSPVTERGTTRRSYIHRLPPHVRDHIHLYHPKIVSLGPYHHGKPHLQQMEHFKRETLAIFLSGCERDKGFFHSKILERIDDVRGCYIGVTKEEYDDKALSEMMLHDASFVIYCMMGQNGNDGIVEHFLYHIGLSVVESIESDMNKLENQIPFWIIKLIFCERMDENEWKDLLCKYFSDVLFGELLQLNKIPWEGPKGEDKKKEPLHLLEAKKMLLGGSMGCSDRPVSRRIPCAIDLFGRKKKGYKVLGSHSATYLKAKGIHFKPSTYCLKDVGFKSRTVYAQLLLPVRFVNTTDDVFFSNIIAFEMSPGAASNLVVTSYVNFMKMLVESPQDVKELRERSILISNLATDEDVVALFRSINSIDPYAVHYDDVRLGIQKHCRQKAKTWIAELLNTNCQSPWTLVALLATIFLLVMSFLQAYFTINPA